MGKHGSRSRLPLQTAQATCEDGTRRPKTLAAHGPKSRKRLTRTVPSTDSFKRSRNFNCDVLDAPPTKCARCGQDLPLCSDLDVTLYFQRYEEYADALRASENDQEGVGANPTWVKRKPTEPSEADRHCPIPARKEF